MSLWRKTSVAVLALGAITLATFPWWLGTALRPILGHYGITFDRYERVGYAHFRVTNLHYAGGRVDLAIREVQTSTPLLWLGQKWFGNGSLVTVNGWLLRLTPAVPETHPTPSTINGMGDVAVLIQHLVSPLTRWLPRVEWQHGELRDLGPVTILGAGSWKNSVLTLTNARVYGRDSDLVVLPATAAPLVVTGNTHDHQIHLRAEWSDLDMKGEATVWDQPLQLSVRFPHEGWMPTDASAVAENWRLPAAQAKLNAPYTQVLGEARAVWHEGAVDISAKAKAETAAGQKAPPFEAQAAAHGTLRELTLTAFQLHAPFGQAELTAPVTFGFDHPLAAESARLTIEADLAKLPWIEARGKVHGVVTVNGDTAAARQVFQLNGEAIALGRFSLAKATARGDLAWPFLHVDELALQLDAASSVTAHGTVNWQTNEFSSVALQAKLAPAWFASWLPAGLTWADATLDAALEGPLTAPRHHGSLQMTQAHWSALSPMAIAVSWDGQSSAVEKISGKFTAAQSTADFTGSLDERSIRLTEFAFAPAGQIVWKLAAPTKFSWGSDWHLDELQLSGPQSRLSAKGTGGPDGSFELSAGTFDSHWLQDFLPLPGPQWQVHELQANGHITDGALLFNATGTAQIEMSPRPAEVKLVASSDGHGVDLKELTVIESDRILTQARGRLPIAWRVESAPHWTLDESAPLDLAASTAPDSPLWAALAASTGLKLVEPSAQLHVKGTLREPAGELQAQAKQVSVTVASKNFSSPELTDLNVALQLGRGEVILKTLATKFDGQSVAASGKLPMNDQSWQQLWTNPAAVDWSQAEGHLEIPDADLAVLARRIPDFMAPSGRLKASVQLSPGTKFAGELHLTNAAARPLPPFGTLQEVNADIVLADRTFTLRSVAAKLGGEPVALEGTVTYAPEKPWRLALGLKGKNLPLVRNTGLLVRTDIDLRTDTDDAGLTHVTGTVTLRDSLVLANLGSLLPTGQRGVTRQPPYFAVDTEPFRFWPIAVAVRGPQAVRIRTPVFTGTASARFQLSGTLGEPRAVGELTVDRGQVLFPFATFEVQSGNLRLRESDPFHAVVALNATAQRRNYQLRLEATGALPAPTVTFSSTPTLDAEDVLLMVMTGQPPTGQVATTFGGQRLALLGAYFGRGLFQDLGFAGGDRLEISSGQQISEQGRETYEFEYKLNDRWSLTGEYDQFDSYNAGFKWRAYFKDGDSSEKKK